MYALKVEAELSVHAFQALRIKSDKYHDDYSYEGSA